MRRVAVTEDQVGEINAERAMLPQTREGRIPASEVLRLSPPNL
jgi:hypothetical protein